MAKVCLFTATWFCLVFAGSFELYEFYRTPGSQGVSLSSWPLASALVRAPTRNTLLVFLHSECACSRATVAELETLTPAFLAETEMQIIFYKPINANPDIKTSALWKRAETVHGAHVEVDLSGAEAARFGARTSGQTYLYDRDGHLLFAGGLTPGRDHSGPSEGILALNSLLKHRASAPIVTTPTFGCPISKQHLAQTMVKK